jgi:hypothetical protein
LDPEKRLRKATGRNISKGSWSIAGSDGVNDIGGYGSRRPGVVKSCNEVFLKGKLENLST